MSNFKKFAKQLENQFNGLTESEVYEVALADPLELWNFYLDAFPAGTNEIFRVNREYDGSYDRNVIRQIGHLVTLKDGVYTSIWDAKDIEYPFNVVAEKIKEFLATKPILGLAAIAERKLGHVKTIETLPEGSDPDHIVWFHFHAESPLRLLTGTVRTAQVASARTNVEMFLTSLLSLKKENINQVLELIEAGSLYKGEEYRRSVNLYNDLRKGYSEASDKESFLWEVVSKDASARLKNTLIGTLIDDLNTKDLENAVKAYESKAAPHNYKRPTALITQGMIKKCIESLRKIGLEDSLERRYAVMSDVNVTDVKWVNNDTSKAMKGSLEDLFGSATAKPGKSSKNIVGEIHIDDFMSDVLPTASKLEVLFENRHKGNLVSLTAGVNDDAKNLFKWDNNMAWSYVGDMAASSITERVKSAGGKVEGALRVSLAWHNTDDLDLHCVTPRGTHVHYGNKCDILDVDANASNLTTTPVENMVWDRENLADGIYTFKVHQFSKRNSADVGFELEVSANGVTHSFTYPNAVASKKNLSVLEITCMNGDITEVKTVSSRLKGGNAPETLWGIATQDFVEVSTVMLSPNHWGGSAEGHKHFIFAVEGCRNPDSVRGFYNEYLRDDLAEHRKSLEVLGSRTKAPYSEDQISGLGFSATRSDVVDIRVTSPQGVKTYKVKF